MIAVEDVLGRLERAKRNGSGWVACCPAHDDRTPSLSVREGDSGRPLFHCHAGCTFDAIVAALGLQAAELLPERVADNGRREIVAVYPYRDEGGALLYQTVRFHPKDFRQRQPDGAGGWIWNLTGARRVLYRLPELREAIAQGVAPIYVTEGEKDADAIRAAGHVVATTSPMGAGKWRDEYADQLEGAGWVVVVADNDEPGINHARKVAASLRERGIDVNIGTAASGKDASDHLAAGHTLGELVPLPDDETTPEPEALNVVTVEEFAAVDEPGADALLGDPGEALIPEGGDVMVYGDGGAGKTTLTIDQAFHFAAGDDWLTIRVARALRVLLIENEGPRPLFRAKLRRKLEAWEGSPIDDRILVIEAPWARLTFNDPRCRQALADTIRNRQVDVVICGPVTRSGMNEAGTLQEVRDFMALVDDARRLADRHVTFVLVHHESKGGKVSGAWEGAGDTLLHVQGQGHGRTRLYIQKARWSSAHHATTLKLVWTDGEGFAVDDTPELDNETLADRILAHIRENPGTAWSKAEKATPGVERQRRRQVRDGLFAARLITNVVKENGEELALDHCPERKTSRLYLADDPTIAHLRRDPGADAAQTAPPWGENLSAPSAPCAPPYKGRRRSGADSPPSETTNNDDEGTSS